MNIDKIIEEKINSYTKGLKERKESDIYREKKKIANSQYEIKNAEKQLLKIEKDFKIKTDEKALKSLFFELKNNQLVKDFAAKNINIIAGNYLATDYFIDYDRALDNLYKLDILPSQVKFYIQKFDHDPDNELDFEYSINILFDGNNDFNLISITGFGIEYLWPRNISKIEKIYDMLPKKIQSDILEALARLIKGNPSYFNKRKNIPHFIKTVLMLS